MRDYSRLTREEMWQRLDAAEDVCVLFGWSPVQHGERADATFEAWLRWGMLGGDSTRKGNPHLTDGVIAAMHARRKATRDANQVAIAWRLAAGETEA